MANNADVDHAKLSALLPRLNRFAISLTGKRSDADDLLQATVQRLLEKGAPDAGGLDKWAFRICKNIWIDGLRSQTVRIKALMRGEFAGDDCVDGERIVIGKLTFAQVRRAMAKLPVEQRAALSLIAIEGFSCADAAEALEIPIGTVMSRIARARATLSAEFRSDEIEIKATKATSKAIAK